MNSPSGRSSTNALFLLAGAASLVIGAALAFAPVALRAHGGTATDLSASSLSEIRAPGGALLAIGTLLLLARSREAWRRPALATTSVTFLGYAVGRALSIAVDGVPSPDLVAAALVELGFGGWALFELVLPQASDEESVAQATIS